MLKATISQGPGPVSAGINSASHQLGPVCPAWTLRARTGRDASGIEWEKDPRAHSY